MDEFDRRILKVVEANSDISLKEIGHKVGIFSPSAISKRIDSLKEEGYIKRMGADLDYEKLGFNFITMTFVRAKYQKDYKDVIGKELSQLPGVISVYFLLGDVDFVIITVNKSKEDYQNTLETLTSIEGVERTDSRTVLQVFKENDYHEVKI